MTTNVIISAEDLIRVKSRVGYPILDEVILNDMDIRVYAVKPALEEYFRWFPIQATQEVTISGKYEIDFPDEYISMELRKLLNNFSIAIPDLKFACISTEGGFIASKLIKTTKKTEEDLYKNSAMTYSLFRASNQYAWLLKKMNADSILLDCDDKFQFIYGLGKAIFSDEIGKSRQKLGLIRLILPQFSNKIRNLIKQAFEIQNSNIFDINKSIKELNLVQGD